MNNFTFRQSVFKSRLLQRRQTCLKCGKGYVIDHNTLIGIPKILIEWGLTPFLTISQLYHGGQFTYSCIS